MSRYGWLSLITLLFTVVSCTQSLPELEGIDRQVWKDDKNGCIGKRAEMIDAITRQKDELLGLSETGLVELLGKPDQNELYKRNQKFYYYFIQPSAECHGKPHAEHSERLVIRFNAMGLAKEIGVERL